MKKILIISYCYPPYNAPGGMRPYSLAKYLNKNLYEVTVLTYNYYESTYGLDPLFNEKINGVKLIRLGNINDFEKTKMDFSKDKSILKNRQWFVIKVLKFFFKYVFLFVDYFKSYPDFTKKWTHEALNYLNNNNNNNDYDIVFSTSPMISNHLIALELKKNKPNIKWTSDFRDFHYSYFLEKKWYNFKHSKIERLIINKSDSVTFISDSMKDLYSKIYPQQKNKFFSVYNGFDMSLINKESLLKINKKKLSIFYAGTFYGGKRSPFHLLMNLEKMVNEQLVDPNLIQIEIAGKIDNNIYETVKDYKIFPIINFLGIIPKSEVLNKMKKTHILWLIVANEIHHYTGVPLKFYEYLACRRYILNFAPIKSEVSSIIQNNKLGWNFFIDKHNYDDFKNIFLDIMRRFQNNKLNDPLENDIAIDQFDRKNQVFQFDEIINLKFKNE